MLRCSAADHIKRGDADLMLAGAGDAAIIPSGIGGFIACKVMVLSWLGHDPGSSTAQLAQSEGREGSISF